MKFTRQKPYLVPLKHDGTVVAGLQGEFTELDDLGMPVIFVDKDHVVRAPDPNSYHGVIISTEGYQLEDGSLLVVVKLKDPLGFHTLMYTFDLEG